MGSAPASPNLTSYIAPEELGVTTKTDKDYFDLPLDVGEGPSGLGSGGGNKEADHGGYERMGKLLGGARGGYVPDDDSDTDFSDLGNGTSIDEPLGPVGHWNDNDGGSKLLERIPIRWEKADKKPEDDGDEFDPGDFPAYFANGEHDHLLTPSLLPLRWKPRYGHLSL
jgi:hypothetical protein